MATKILITEDDKNIQTLLKFQIERYGYDCDIAGDGERSLELIKKNSYNLVLLDLFLPKKHGEEILDTIKKIYPDLPVIILTANKDIDVAVSCIKTGAFDFITKPIDLSRFQVSVKNALELSKMKSENKQLKNKQRSSNLFKNIVGESKEILGIYNKISRVLNTKLNILIIGESGTGKELLARAIHMNSSRKDGPFITVNSAAIHSTLSDSLLFGHMKGSFTGANEDRMGYFEQAHGGTIFLDEIGDMPLDLQAKILRVLEERTIRRIGEKQEKKLDFRLISATNVNLSDAVNSGAFRKDLYFRLEEFPIYLPSLNERKGDIEILATYFLNELCENENFELMSFSEDAIEDLKGHHWEGNIRELKNVVIRSALQASTKLIENIVFTRFSSRKERKDLVEAGEIVPLEEIEHIMINRAYKRAKENAADAANLLGISKATMYRKLQKLGLDS